MSVQKQNQMSVQKQNQMLALSGETDKMKKISEVAEGREFNPSQGGIIAPKTKRKGKQDRRKPAVPRTNLGDPLRTSAFNVLLLQALSTYLCIYDTSLCIYVGRKLCTPWLQDV
jgi:hypothetical protein